jgi:hypothetical protein
MEDKHLSLGKPKWKNGIRDQLILASRNMYEKVKNKFRSNSEFCAPYSFE